MAIQDDFTINPDTKVIRHDSSKTSVYTAVQFYSFLQDTFDEPGFLSYEIPIRFNTPTSFTMLNGWFLDDGDGSNILQFLTGGGIDTLGYATITDSVLMIDLDYATRSFIATDLDKTITHDGTVIGPLLSYKDDYPSASTARIWVRDTTVAGTETTIPGEIIDVTAGDGNYTSTGYSAIGDNIYHNLFTIAAFPASATDANPQVYVYQNHPVDGTRTRIAEWSHLSNWGDGEPIATNNQSRGSIDVLITIQLGGVLIDGGNISTFVRQTGDTFTFVESILTTSGRTPIATESSSDEVNITVGEHYLLFDASTGAGAFAIGDIITNVPMGTPDVDLLPPTWYAEIFAVEEFTTTTGLLTLKGLNGTIANNDTIYVGSVAKATSNGTPGDTVVAYTGTDPVTLGNIIAGSVSTARRILRGVDTTENRAVLQDDPIGVTGASRDVYYKDFLNTDTLQEDPDGANNARGTVDATSTTLISGFNDITVAHINGTITVADGSVFTAGDRVTWAGGGTGIFIENNANVITLGNVPQSNEPDSTDTIVGDQGGSSAASTNFTRKNTEDFAFSLQAAFTYAVFIEGGSIYNAGRSLSDIYAYLQFYVRDGQNITERTIFTSDGSITISLAGEEYIKAKSSYNATKSAPFGTIAGGVFFSAQGVWLQGMAAADNNNIRLLDDSAVLHTPELSITITVTNTRADDRVAIYRDAGGDELPDKNQFTSHVSNNVLHGETFDVGVASTGANGFGAFPNDTPTGGTAGGTFIVVDNTLNKQHRYRYDSFNALGGGGTDGRLALPVSVDGTKTSGTGQTFIDTGGGVNADGDFTAGGTRAVQVGDIIHRTSGTLGFAYVTDITNAATGTLLTTLIEDTSGTANKGWGATDAYQIHSLVKTYSNSDTFFIPYMDTIENVGTNGSPGSINVSLTYVSDRTIIIEVRNVKAATEIVPFKTPGTITNTGLSQGVIRNEDTVFTP